MTVELTLDKKIEITVETAAEYLALQRLCKENKESGTVYLPKEAQSLLMVEDLSKELKRLEKVKNDAD